MWGLDLEALEVEEREEAVLGRRRQRVACASARALG
jgi:hypothetical protein